MNIYIYATARQYFKGDYDIIAITMATVELCKVPSKTHMYVLQIIVKTNLLTYYFSLIFKAPQIMFSFWPYTYDNRSILQKRSCLQNSAVKLLVRLSVRLGIMNIACTQKN